MFEREIRDASFVKRWSIVRTIRDQSIAEHQYFVTMYANDIASALDLPQMLHLALLQQCLWHDLKDEIFTGDIPGPAKRALCPDKDSFKEKCRGWTHKVFGILGHRDGTGLKSTEQNVVTAILKAADELDAACEMATEVQLGNQNCVIRVLPPMQRGLGHLDVAFDLIGTDPATRSKIRGAYQDAVRICQTGDSRGPNVFGEGFDPQ